MLHSKAFQATIWLLLVFLIIWVAQHIDFIFRPFIVILTTVFFPALVAGILFYLTDPVVNQLESWRIPRTTAILLIFLFFGILILFGVLYLVPILQQQLSSLIRNLPGFLRELDKQVTEFQQSTIFSRFEQFEFFRRWSNIDYISVVDSIVDRLSENILGVIGSIANFFVVLFTIPFFLFYMLKDGHQISKKVSATLPNAYRQKGENFLSQVSQMLRDYVQGVLTVSLFVAISAYIGYRIIGVDYALLLSAVALVTNVVPFVGPLVGTIPGVIIGFTASPWTALKVVIMIFIIQQLESQLITPQVMGRKLRIHPVTIIVVLLAAGSLGGILAIILAVPTFAVMRIIAGHIYLMFQENEEDPR